MIGHRVERSVDFDVAIGGDRSTAHAEETEAGIRKRSEMLLFFDKAGPDLLLGGAVDALAGDSLVPTLQMLILRIQALEAASFERGWSRYIRCFFRLFRSRSERPDGWAARRSRSGERAH